MRVTYLDRERLCFFLCFDEEGDGDRDRDLLELAFFRSGDLLCLTGDRSRPRGEGDRRDLKGLMGDILRDPAIPRRGDRDRLRDGLNLGGDLLNSKQALKEGTKQATVSNRHISHFVTLHCNNPQYFFLS